MADIDFKDMKIKVDHQLQRYNNEYHILEPKTKSGIREVPMTDAVAECFRKILKQRKCTGFVMMHIQDYERIYKDMVKILFVCHTKIYLKAMNGKRMMVYSKMVRRKKLSYVMQFQKLLVKRELLTERLGLVVW